MNKEEWRGSRPCKFRGGIQISSLSNRSRKDLLAPSAEYTLKSISPRFSKRHFPEKLSPVVSTWKSGAKLVQLDAASFIREKTSEVSNIINPGKQTSRLLRSSVTQSNLNTNKKSSLTRQNKQDQFITNEEKLEVQNILSWEKSVLLSVRPSHQSPEPGFQSRADRCAARLSQVMRNKIIC